MKSKIKIGKCFVVLTLFLVSVTCIYTAARYAKKLNFGTTGMFAKTIVLSSDLLKEESNNKTIYEKLLLFSISNYNDNKITYNDLKYQITVMDNDGSPCVDCIISINNLDKNSNTLVSSNSTQKSTDKINISFPRLGTYLIEARSVNTTNVTISSTVNVSASEDYSYYQINDQESYIELVIKTSNNVTDSTVFTINTSNLIPDNYNVLMENWVTQETQTLTGLSPNNVYSLLFFKTNISNNYSKQESIIDNNVINILKN